MAAAILHPSKFPLSLQTSASSSLQAKRLGSPVCLSVREVSGDSLNLPSLVRKSSARVTCAVVYAPPSTARLDLLEDIERRWERVEKYPMEGVPFTYEEFEEALAKDEYSFEVGTKVRGTIFRCDGSGAMVDIGAKAPAFLPTAEACLFKVKRLEELGIAPGVEEDFIIIEDDDIRGKITLSIRRLQFEMAWERCRQMLEDDATVRGQVILVNKGGLLVLVEGLRAFVPLSQLAVRTPKEDLPGRVLPLKFLEVDEERTRLVLSNRRAMAESSAAATFNVGDVVIGRVQSVKPYGAFVDVGGVNGLLHISQISHDRVTNVETVLSEGDQLKVMILSHDRDRGRLSLSTKKLEPTPGDMLRNPQLVYEKADEMAKTFRERVALAEAAARAEEERLRQQGLSFGLDLAGGSPAAAEEAPFSGFTSSF
eukprot:TRINITY_DN950_c0_g1_i1.p1 TRINITY_DN950_c0_g1~~TRINITY_DN950_c0_g1_i1.p1  ORF type:complete len:445 (+),score=125.47 TRINITY_DN950_c0_g1_i1:61-1335(+)